MATQNKIVLLKVEKSMVRLKTTIKNWLGHYWLKEGREAMLSKKLFLFPTKDIPFFRKHLPKGEKKQTCPNHQGQSSHSIPLSNFDLTSPSEEKLVLYEEKKNGHALHAFCYMTPSSNKIFCCALMSLIEYLTNNLILWYNTY